MISDGTTAWALGVRDCSVQRRNQKIIEESSSPVLAPEQMVILQDEPAEARRIARLYLAPYLAQPNYQNSLRRLGFTDDDFGGGGTDGLIDALVAWGAEDAIVKRIQAHHDAGADHVCVQPVADPTQGFPIASIRRLSEALLRT